jgi:two-component system chemotaxis response regulator CheY
MFLNMLTKVLIVDDSEPLHQIYKVTLKRYKCETISVLKREDALQKLDENPGVDLILVDMNMSLSRLSGFEFIKRVKEQEAYSDIPIVVVSTRGRESDAKEALPFAKANLVKPFTSNEIHRLIEKLFPQAVSA